jgi:hypothetical protein
LNALRDGREDGDQQEQEENDNLDRVEVRRHGSFSLAFGAGDACIS